PPPPAPSRGRATPPGRPGPRAGWPGSPAGSAGRSARPTPPTRPSPSRRPRPRAASTASSSRPTPCCTATPAPPAGTISKPGCRDAHADELPVRAAWRARAAVTRLCDGDALGLARWRDRLLNRLRDRGPVLDLDEPSFLRFHGTTSADRFQTARDWLAKARNPILGWVDKLGSGGRLQWAGIDAETESTKAYAQLMLAWGLGCLGEWTRSRDW